MMFDRTYKCKQCGENLHREDTIKHLVAEHDPDWRGSFEEALDEYHVSIRRVKQHEEVETQV